MLAAVFSTQANAVAFASAIWDWVRTMRRAKKATWLPGSDPSDYDEQGGGRHVDVASLPAPNWRDAIKNLTLSQWAIPIRPWMIDSSVSISVVGSQAVTIRNILCSGPTITLGDGTVIQNSFWAGTAAATLARWNSMVSNATGATQLTPAGWLYMPPP